MAVAQQGDKMVTAELFASVPQSVGNITFAPDNRVIYSHHPFFSPEIRVAEQAGHVGQEIDRGGLTPYDGCCQRAIGIAHAL